jgi:type II secretory pathway component HofQ
MLATNKIFHKGVPEAPAAGKDAEVKFLGSWKEIASYMGKGIRTVQRYEAELGLPVRRPAGKSRAAVVATRAEIDEWIQSSPVRQALQKVVPELLVRDPGLKEIREGIREMHELRRQMRELRAETGSSLKILITGLQALAQANKAQGTSQKNIFPPREERKSEPPSSWEN